MSAAYVAAQDRFRAAVAARDRAAAVAALELMKRVVRLLEASVARALFVADEATAWLLNNGIEPPGGDGT
jgi:hypothetical protein